MTNKRDIFAELTEGFDALKSEREGKLTLRTFKVENKPAPVLSPQDVLYVREQLRLSRPVFAHYLRTNPRTGLAADSNGGAVSGHGAAPGLDLGLVCHRFPRERMKLLWFYSRGHSFRYIPYFGDISTKHKT